MPCPVILTLAKDVRSRHQYINDKFKNKVIYLIRKMRAIKEIASMEFEETRTNLYCRNR